MPSAIPCGLSLLISRIYSCLFSDWGRTVSSKFFDTQALLVSTENLVLPLHACCALSRLRCKGHSLLSSSYLTKIGRIKNPSCSACGQSSQDIFCTVQLQTVSTTSNPGPGELPDFWGSMVFRHALIPRKGSGNNNNRFIPQFYNYSNGKQTCKFFLFYNSKISIDFCLFYCANRPVSTEGAQLEWPICKPVILYYS